MSQLIKKILPVTPLVTLFACGLAYAVTETVVVTQPVTKSTVVTTDPSPTTGTTTTTTKETTVTTPTTVEKQVIVTPAPTAKEVVVAPSGFVNCFTVASGWRNNEWIPQHQICQYENSPEGVSWVEGYWACTQYKMSQGICTNWDWRPGHWTKTLVVY